MFQFVKLNKKYWFFFEKGFRPRKKMNENVESIIDN